MVATSEKFEELEKLNEVEALREQEHEGEVPEVEDGEQGDESPQFFEEHGTFPELEYGRHGGWPGKYRKFGKCKFEVGLPHYPPLTGAIRAEVYENGKPSNCIIRADKEWSVRVHWYLKGALQDCICGYWCLNLFMESIGPGPELVIPYHKLIPLRPCGNGHYWYEIKVPAGFITPKHCSIPYQLVAGVTYRTPCKKPGPISGFCKLPMIQFYESSKRFT